MKARKRLPIALVLLLIVGVPGALLLGYALLRPALMEQRLNVSRDGRHSVRVLIGAPFIFGPYPLRIEAKRAGDFFFHKVAETMLANDGKALRPGQPHIRLACPRPRPAVPHRRGAKTNGHRDQYDFAAQG